MSHPDTASKKPVLIFDMNETLLDLTELKKSISRTLGEEEAVSLWFETLLHYSLVDTVSGVYHNFGKIGVAALMMVAAQRDINLSKKAAQEALKPIRQAPAFPEVPVSLEKIKSAGYKMAVLTNSSSEGMHAQLKNAGIKQYFDQCLSVEDIGKYKPHREVYDWAARQLDVKANKCLFIAAHGWDIAGAIAVGMQTAFLSRPGHTLYPLSAEPDYIAEDLADLSHKLIP